MENSAVAMGRAPFNVNPKEQCFNHSTCLCTQTRSQSRSYKFIGVPLFYKGLVINYGERGNKTGGGRGKFPIL